MVLLANCTIILLPVRLRLQILSWLYLFFSCRNCSLPCWRLSVFVCEMRLERVVKRRALQLVACFDLIMVCLESFAEGCITKWFDIPFWLYKNAWTKSCARTEQWNQMLWWICFCLRLMQMLQSTLKSAIFNRPFY